jgi:hypothetical protein
MIDERNAKRCPHQGSESHLHECLLEFSISLRMPLRVSGIGMCSCEPIIWTTAPTISVESIGSVLQKIALFAAIDALYDA